MLCIKRLSCVILICNTLSIAAVVLLALTFSLKLKILCPLGFVCLCLLRITPDSTPSTEIQHNEVHMENMLLPIITNTLLGFIMVAFLMLTLQRKLSVFATFCATTAFVMFSLFIFLLIPVKSIFLKQAIAFIIIAAGSRLLYSDSTVRIIVCAFTILLNEWVCELVCSLFYTLDMYNIPQTYQLEPITQLGLYTVYVSLYALLSWVFSLIYNRFFKIASWYEILSYILFPCMQLAMVVWSLLPTFYGNTDTVRLFVVFFCFAADIGLYFSLRGITQSAELKAKNDMLSMQIDAEKEHYTALAEQYENMRILRHDIANHIHTIKVLLETGQSEQASEYAQDILPKHTFKSNMGNCENPIVDAFLYSRINKAKENSIEILATAAIPYESGIASADMIIALGNMLDNAEEACRNIPTNERRIKIDITAKDGICTIKTENPMPLLTSPKKQHIRGMERGVGFVILERLAEQYGGAFIYGTNESCFYSMLTLQTNRL